MDTKEKKEKVASLIREGKYKIAEIWIQNHLKQYPMDIGFYYLRAENLYFQNFFLEAIGQLEFIKQKFGKQLIDIGAFFIEELLAYCWNSLGENKKAALSFKSASKFSTDCRSRANMYSNYLFLSNYFSDITNEALFLEHKEYNDIFKDITYYTHENRKTKKERIRIGYISPDFREHVVTYFSYMLLAKYNKGKYEVFCYALGKTDPVTEQLKNMVDQWRLVKDKEDQEIAEQIYQDEIDILVDLSGHSANNSLPILARKPAPIQISGIGYFNTTGLLAVDYFLTDIYCDPVGQNDDLFTEKLLRLPYSHFCYTPPDTAFSYEMKKTMRDHIVFGSFNNFFKITDEVLSAWLMIVKRVPGSKLLLKNPQFNKRSRLEEVRERALKIGFSESMVELRDASIDYLNEYADIDIALDTFPYPGGGTTCEALFMGCPVVTLRGTRHGARFGYSILKNIGLEELAGGSVEEYVEIAVGLASDRELLTYLQKNMRSMMQKSYLMNGENYIQEVEKAYTDIWARWVES